MLSLFAGRIHESTNGCANSNILHVLVFKVKYYSEYNIYTHYCSIVHRLVHLARPAVITAQGASASHRALQKHTMVTCESRFQQRGGRSRYCPAPWSCQRASLPILWLQRSHCVWAQSLSGRWSGLRAMGRPPQLGVRTGTSTDLAHTPHTVCSALAGALASYVPSAPED